VLLNFLMLALYSVMIFLMRSTCPLTFNFHTDTLIIPDYGRKAENMSIFPRHISFPGVDLRLPTKHSVPGLRIDLSDPVGLME
jgi:hypothetical protein